MLEYNNLNYLNLGLDTQGTKAPNDPIAIIEEVNRITFELRDGGLLPNSTAPVIELSLQPEITSQQK